MSPENTHVCEVLRSSSAPIAALNLRQRLGITHEQVYASLAHLEANGLVRLVVSHPTANRVALVEWEAM